MISFVVPAYNEAALIEETVQALHRAAGDVDYEVIVADDASTDATAELAANAGARVVTVDNRQIAATRNAGAREARGDVFVFVDADTIVPVETVAALRESLAEGVVAGGCRCTFDEPVPRLAKLVLAPFLFLYRKARLTPGAFLFCTRAAFEATGGYDERQFGGEEVFFARALDRYAKTQGTRFTILDAHIVTSGRKLRTYSTWELLRAMVGPTLRLARSRKGMDLWYGERRADPQREKVSS